MVKIVCIIQARMGSTRLPGKVMKKINGKTILYYVVERMKQSKLINQIVIATTTNTQDDVIVKEAERLDVESFRGSEEDVLSRYYFAAKRYTADVVVRITSDCPLIDPEITDKIIRFYLDNGIYNLVTNAGPIAQNRTFPRGLDAEVFSFDILKEAFDNATEEYQREHVTPFIRKNKKLFKNKNIENDQDLSKYRITIDEKEDLIVIREIIEKLENKENYDLSDIINVLESNKEIIEKNKKFERNEGYKKSLEEDEKIK